MIKKRTKAKKAGRPTQGSEESAKEKILNSFIQLSYEQGIESITLQKIADHSGLAMNTVRYHFKIQGLNLSQVAVDFVAEKNFEFIEKKFLENRGRADFDPVNCYAESQFEWLTNEPIQACMLFYYFFLCTTKIPLEVENTELMELARKRLIGFINEGVGIGIYKRPTDVENLSRDLYMIISGACFSLATSRNKSYRKETITRCKTLLRGLLSPR
jgi:hypothetical protein